MVTIPHQRFEIPRELPGFCSLEKLTKDNQKHTALSYAVFGLLLARPRSPVAEADPLKGSPVSVRTRPGAPSIEKVPPPYACALAS
jgi:hypothetical protein